ncbi:P1 family peptidase [soil metagenome]
MKNNTLTALNGVKVGHATRKNELTGCTFVLFDRPYPVAYKAYGGGPGTFNTDLLQNGKDFYHRHGLFISGGSLTGLQCGTEIMKGLIEQGIGYKNYAVVNPSISGAIIFDLGMRIKQLDPRMGREALENVTNKPVADGNVGAGTGATVGKFWDADDGKTLAAMKSGVGSARVNLDNGAMVCALSVVNAVGNVVLPNGQILSGNRSDLPGEKYKTFSGYAKSQEMPENTTITIVGTNVALPTREQYEKVAHLASQGHVRAINPVHASVDGDTVFVFSTEEVESSLSHKQQIEVKKDLWHQLETDIIGNAAAQVVQESIYNACYAAETIPFKDALNGTIPSCHDYP